MDAAASPPAPVLRGPGRAFRASLRLFLQPVAWLAPPAGALLAAALVALSSPAAGVRLTAPELFGLAAVVWLLSALGVAMTLLLYTAFCPVRVGVDGLTGFSFWGLPLSLPWGEVTEASRRRLFGFPYLIVASGRRGRALWIALPLADMAAFEAALAEHGGPDNPVSVVLTTS